MSLFNVCKLAGVALSAFSALPSAAGAPSGLNYIPDSGKPCGVDGKGCRIAIGSTPSGTTVWTNNGDFGCDEQVIQVPGILVWDLHMAWAQPAHSTARHLYDRGVRGANAGHVEWNGLGELRGKLRGGAIKVHYQGKLCVRRSAKFVVSVQLGLCPSKTNGDFGGN
ncbi:hypothetical protein B0H19DRAFT_1059307 [Mycena capillaripes]|nr:hypothetical protein B0H19DRAFT_1059307 [Mycena capillaripes]